MLELFLLFAQHFMSLYLNVLFHQFILYASYFTHYHYVPDSYIRYLEPKEICTSEGGS